MLNQVLKNLDDESKILDFGCLSWTVYHESKKINKNFVHYACDIIEPSLIPADINFFTVDEGVERLDIEDDSFDLIVLSHVLEHVSAPVPLFEELVRICKPGGRIYVETPSDRSVSVKSDKCAQSHSFYNFWDDPTHIRPYSPAGLYRLAISFCMIPEEVKYIGNWLDVAVYPFYVLLSMVSNERFELTVAMWKRYKWACYMVARKPENKNGRIPYKYISLKNVKKGYENALSYRETL
ncbi:MAG: class I SAM-dependent methyltransferase [Alphaproteobacteria bacterium]